MSDGAAPGAERCGIDSVEIARIERLLAETPVDGLTAFFSAQELADAGDGPGRAASLAARFAAKEACLKLFPRGAALGQVEATDFSVERDAYGAPQLVCNAAAQYQLDMNRIAHVKLLERGPSRCSPFMIPMMISNIVAGQIAIDHNLRGPNYSVVSACATGAHCVGDALRLIQRGETDIVLAGGTEAAITPAGYFRFLRIACAEQAK